MDRLLSCECGRELRVSRSQAGQEIKCDCGKIVPVPTLRGLSELPLANAEPNTANAVATGGASPKPSPWQGWRGTTLALAAAGCLIATLFSAWFLLQWSAVPKGYTVAAEIEASNKMLDSFDPNILSSEWHIFSHLGLRTKSPPYLYRFSLYAGERMLMAKIAGAIAAGFAALGFTIWITTGRKLP